MSIEHTHATWVHGTKEGRSEHVSVRRLPGCPLTVELRIWHERNGLFNKRGICSDALIHIPLEELKDLVKALEKEGG